MWTHSARGLSALLIVPVASACEAVPAPAPGTDAPPAEEVALAVLAGDSAAIMDDLRFLSSDALQGRATGSDGAAQARARLAQRFAEAGLESFESDPGVGSGGAEVRAFEVGFTWIDRTGRRPREGVNLLGWMRGAEFPDRYIVVSGHHDHEGVRSGEVYNGADDNASGAVGVAALAKALAAVAPRHSVIFVSFDAEEVGLEGAHAFVASPPVPRAALAVDVNMDMVARTGGVLWAGGAYHTPALRPVLEDVASRAPLELRLGHDTPGGSEGADWTHQSDQGPFQEAGIPFVYLGVDDHPDYHRPTDDFERVDPGEYMNALRTALLTVLALDNALPLPPPPPSSPESLP